MKHELTEAFRAERQAAIEHMEREGLLDPECPTCRDELYGAEDRMPYEVWCPHHKASDGCKSGKRSHCTCDTCF